MRTRPLTGLILVAVCTFISATSRTVGDATNLDPTNPYTVGRHSPKLVTPQWVGEPGVEAVVLLSIDDMRSPGRYEAYLRPILNRLKRIDGRAPVSIFTNVINPEAPQLQAWLKEGLSFECHTIAHPCPLLQKNDFNFSAKTYHECVDMLNKVPNTAPVAFRMPCCDSLNTVSPRFYREIFKRKSTNGNTLQIDSSVFVLFTPNDPDLPRDLVTEADGSSRFAKYVPIDRGFVNYVEDYPYPYVVDGVCWQFPNVVPSDWAAQHRQGVNNPKTVADWKAALDATVIKQGVMSLVFHPHGWIKAEQIVELIDHAQQKHGKKVKFLTFREAADRLSKHLLEDRPIRTKQGGDNGVRIVDVNGDRYMDVAVTDRASRNAKVWLPKSRTWSDWSHTAKPEQLTPLATHLAQLKQRGVKPPAGVKSLGDGKTDLGVRFVDLDEDGHLDLLFSNDKRISVHLWDEQKKAWSRTVIDRARDQPAKDGEPDVSIPAIVRADGSHNGFFVHGRALYWQNERTGDHKPTLVHRVTFNELLRHVEPRGKSPEASLRNMQARPGFKVELVAAEPLIVDPVAFDWGPDGRLWVVEMRDYPNGMDGKGKPGGRVKVLTDRDGDGRYDDAQLFIDDLPFPTGVKVWRDGVLVTAAPDIIFAKDTDGDGKADRREVLYRGFGEGNQQHRVNGLRWGLDNWLYVGNGDSDGRVKSLKTGRIVNVRGRDLCIRPDTGEMEVVSGKTQFGRSRDDWGNWFGGNNSNPMWHYALKDQYLRRNPSVTPPDPRVHVSVTPGASPVFPISRTMPRFNNPQSVNRFTSACSPIVYRDTLFGQPFFGNAFICEPVHNLVHREVMSPRGATFASRRADDEKTSEFLASSDNWFRPAMVRTGPDGGLWVADMYRAIIEHPKWIPDDWEKRLDVRAGQDKGRIYRVLPVHRQPRAIQRLDQMTNTQLVEALASPNGWVRDTAHEMLLWRDAKDVAEALRKVATTHASPLARLHALCVLDGLDALTPATLQTGLADKHAGVRRHAVRLCESHLENDKLRHAVMRLAKDDDTQVRMHLAYTLGASDSEQAGAAIGAMLRDNAAGGNDSFLTAALLTSAPRRLDSVVTSYCAGGHVAADDAVLMALIRTAVVGRKDSVIADLLRSLIAEDGAADPSGRYTAAAALLETLRQRKVTLNDLAERHTPLRVQLGALEKVFDRARNDLRDRKVDGQRRIAAASLLVAASTRATDTDLLISQLDASQPIGLQHAAAKVIVRRGDAETTRRVMANWRRYEPALRAHLIDLLLRRASLTAVLLDHVSSGDVSKAEFDAARRQRLLTHNDTSIRRRAAALFNTTQPAGQPALFDKFKPALTLRGDATRGAAVYTRTCAACHRLGTVGNAVGPDLRAVTDRSPRALLTAILDPNRAVEAKYLAYVVETSAGDTFNGMLTAETGGGVRLIQSDGSPRDIARSDIASLRATGLSLMPTGLAADMTPQSMADLFAFIAGQGPKRKTFANNTPAVIKSRDDGALHLPASKAEIYGPSIVFEQKYRNLGWWSHANDHAVWQLNVRKGGAFDVSFDFACHASAAGNRFTLTVGDATVRGVVPSTGTWDVYKSQSFGRVEIKPGRHQLIVRSDGPIRQALIDLREVRLVPVSN